MTDTKFTGATLNSVNFQRANLSGVSFADFGAWPGLVDPDFTDATLTNVNFNNIDITDAIFTGATLTAPICGGTATGVNFAGNKQLTNPSGC